MPLALLVGTVLAGSDGAQGPVPRGAGMGARTRRATSTVLITESLRGPIVLWSLMLGFHLATQNSEIPRQYLHYVPNDAPGALDSVAHDRDEPPGRKHRCASTAAAWPARRAVTSLTQKLAQMVVVAAGAGLAPESGFRPQPDADPDHSRRGRHRGRAGAAGHAFESLRRVLRFHFRLVRIGDYIKLNTGEEGYVTDINWRCTTMRGITQQPGGDSQQQAGAGDLSRTTHLPEPAHGDVGHVRRGIRVGHRSRGGDTAR